MSLIFVLLMLALLFALGLAEFTFERIEAECDNECRHGGCAFVECTTAASCRGGGCLFTRCIEPSCLGGACVFDDCTRATCMGGGCNFVNQRSTLLLDACLGESCTLDGIPTPALNHGQFLTI